MTNTPGNQNFSAPTLRRNLSAYSGAMGCTFVVSTLTAFAILMWGYDSYDSLRPYELCGVLAVTIGAALSLATLVALYLSWGLASAATILTAAIMAVYLYMLGYALLLLILSTDAVLLFMLTAFVYVFSYALCYLFAKTLVRLASPSQQSAA